MNGPFSASNKTQPRGKILTSHLQAGSPANKESVRNSPKGKFLESVQDVIVKQTSQRHSKEPESSTSQIVAEEKPSEEKKQLPAD